MATAGTIVLLLAATMGLFATLYRLDDSAMQTTESGEAEGDTWEPTRRAAEPAFDAMRAAMVDQQLRRRDIDSPAVLEAMSTVARHEFVPSDIQGLAYSDEALPIAHHQTISQPYIVALMTQLAKPTSESKVLDVGTGSGYQAAVLGKLCKQVYSIEIVEPLASQARERLQHLGYDNIEVRHGDGFGGWPEQAPFDLIIVAAAPRKIPQPLIDQLAPGGRLVIPVGDRMQHLNVVEKSPDGNIKQWRVIPVAFVPMTGKAQK
jgi:protein-L-isoaspartate(D-aspartate) O-methyltransferase